MIVDTESRRRESLWRAMSQRPVRVPRVGVLHTPKDAEKPRELKCRYIAASVAIFSSVATSLP